MNYQTDDIWCVWYHSIKNSSWNNQSYKKIFEITNLYDLKFINDTININFLKNGMFFIMKNNIFPTWEDPLNRKGCCISYKIYDNLLPNKWNYILISLISNNIDIKDNEINGISIIPKNNYGIIKIWLKYNVKKQNINKCFNINDTVFDNSKALVKKNMK